MASSSSLRADQLRMKGLQLDDVSMKKQETKRKLKIAEDIKAELSVGSLD